jgi:pyruvate/2-oxoglutarate dehydrogenase complex dihydrolipoamide dehydrogenase (E3) component
MALMRRLNESGIKTCYECKVTKITLGGVEIIGKDGKARLLKADTVITAFGLKPDTKVIEELAGVVQDTYIIGDSNRVSNIAAANTDAFNIAVEI